MITVLHLITGLRRGGAEASLLRLVTHMDRRRFSNVVISILPPTGYWSEFIDQGVEVHSLEGTSPVSLAALSRLIGHLRRLRPDLVQTWLYHADLVGAAICRPLLKAPLLWNIRNSDMAPGGRLTHRLIVPALATLSPFARVAVVNSTAGLDAHRRAGFRPQRWELIPNGYDLSVFRPDPDARVRWRTALGLDSSVLLVGMIARFAPMKAHVVMLEAFAKLRSQAPGAHLVLAGSGVERHNRDLAALTVAHGIADATILLGERDDIPGLLPAFDILALPSTFGEGFPNVVCEAMACGVPVVATAVGDTADIVRDGGLIVPPHDIEAFGNAMIAIARLDPFERSAMGGRGRAEIGGRFSLEAMVGRYERLYEELAGRTADPRTPSD
jgi:glycosyltransferase involved in cell wall biosynthesis